MAQILIYDDEEMRVLDVLGYFPEPLECTEFDVTPLCSSERKRRIVPSATYAAEISVGEVKAELDPTTMKRIAKYNLEKDLEGLNQRISEAKERLLQIDEEISKNQEKLLLIDELFVKIWEDKDFDKGKYLPDEDKNYAEDGWE